MLYRAAPFYPNLILSWNPSSSSQPFSDGGSREARNHVEVAEQHQQGAASGTCPYCADSVAGWVLQHLRCSGELSVRALLSFATNDFRIKSLRFASLLLILTFLLSLSLCPLSCPGT
jgi:hypothetical protein